MTADVPAKDTSSQAWREAAGQPETAVPLRRLPPGLTLGDELDEPICYDAARHLLLYRGFMCQASYLYLHKLSADPAYQTAIDGLYQGSAVDHGRGSFRLFLTVVASAAAIAAGIGAWLWLR